mgnify:CR=1 FL=1
MRGGRRAKHYVVWGFPKPLLAKLRAQQPDLAAGNKEVQIGRAHV